MIEWDEPFSNDPLTNLHCSMTRDDAIKFQIAYVKTVRPDWAYESDEQALFDFKVVRMAYETEEK